MSARDTLRGMAFQLATSSGVVPPDEFDAALDAYRAEILAEAKVETVDWLVKKVSEYRSTRGRHHALQADAIEILASKVDRGAVRAFLGTAHYRDAMDAHRAKVLREATKKVREVADAQWADGRAFKAVHEAADLIDPDEQAADTEAGAR